MIFYRTGPKPNLQMHLTIEQRAPNRQWHAIWDTDLQQTKWFMSRYGAESYTNPHNLNALTPNSPILFRFLSSATGQSFHSLHGVGTKSGGIFDTGDVKRWPQDISACAKARERPDHELQSFGCATLAHLIEIENAIHNLYKSKNDHINAERTWFLLWMDHLRRIVNMLRGPDGLMKKIISQVPQIRKDREDPDYPVENPTSAHERIALLSGDTWYTLLEGDDNIRILVSYSTRVEEQLW